MNALGRALDKPDSYFKEMTSGGNSILRPIHYSNGVHLSEPEDACLMTILMSGISGSTELLDRHGKWQEVVIKKGELVVAPGKMLARITDDKIKATTHRLTNPKGLNQKSYSMAFFVIGN